MSPVFVVIVNYRTGALAVDCISSLMPMRDALRGGRVVVVDNDSRDDSVETIGRAIGQRGWAPHVELIALPRNGGFAYGNNAAIARVRAIAPEFAAVLLINPDTLVRAGAVRSLIERLEADPRIGVVGARIEDEHGAPQSSAHPVPSPLGELEGSAAFGPLTRWVHASSTPWLPRTAPHECDWVSGACMGIKRAVLDAIGPMDEGFFLYFEEVDFCLRARRAGWSCWFDPAACVVHYEGASTGIKVARRPRPPYWYASRRRFFVKAYGIAGLIAADLLWALGRASLVVRRTLGLGGGSGADGEPSRVARDLLGGDIKALLNGELVRVPRIRQVA